MTIICILFVLLVGVTFLFAQKRKEVEMIARNIENLKQDYETRLANLNSELSQARLTTEAHIRDLSLKSAQLKAANDTILHMNEQSEREAKQRQEALETQMALMREQMRSQFEKEMTQRTAALKQEAEERMTTLKNMNSQQMENIVAPLKQELTRLRDLTLQTSEAQSKNTTSLEASIKAVFEHDKERDKTTRNLAEALRNRGKVQGDWGEMVLENILRDSGLREGEEYVKQYNVKSGEGADKRPDVIVKGSDGTRIIIDSKVSLTAYTDYVGAESDEERSEAIRANYNSILKHVSELSNASYQKIVDNAVPIVLMFVPNEGSYILAMNHDPQLGAKAYNKGVLIINPTNLMVVLRLIFLTWQNTRQEKNNKAILSAAAKIYEKYSTFAESYMALGNQLLTVRNTYDKGMGQLKEGRGNLSKQLQDLLQYGVTPNKTLPTEMEGVI